MGEYDPLAYGGAPAFVGHCIKETKDNGEVSVNMVRIGKEVERVGNMGPRMPRMFMNPQRVPWVASALFLPVMVESRVALVLAAGICGAVGILEVASPGFITTFLRRRWSLIPGRSVLRAACCVLRAACCVLCATCCVAVYCVAVHCVLRAALLCTACCVMGMCISRDSVVPLQNHSLNRTNHSVDQPPHTLSLADLPSVDLDHYPVMFPVKFLLCVWSTCVTLAPMHHGAATVQFALLVLFTATAQAAAKLILSVEGKRQDYGLGDARDAAYDALALFALGGGGPRAPMLARL